MPADPTPPLAPLRDRIAAKLAGLTCVHDEITACPGCAADAVMELFPDVWQQLAVGGRPCYVLRTAPEPIGDTHV